MKKLKLISLAFIFLILSLLFAVGYGFYSKKTPFFILQHNYSREILTISKEGELLAGNKVIGEFKSRNNFLGIVEIRFLTYGRESRDSVIFRLKEKSSKEWHYVNTYKAKEFGGYPLFPFGFPIINDSKGKQYYFELESLYGKPGSAVGISMVESVIVVKHKFNVSYLLGNRKDLVEFLFAKIKEIIQETNAIRYFIAIYTFLIFLLILKKMFSKVTIRPFIHFNKMIQIQSKKSYKVLRLFIKLQQVILSVINFLVFIIAFIMKRVYSFHRWLVEE